MIRYIAAGGTDAGLRGSTNQDSFGAKIIRSRGQELAAVIMCDGMGGYSSGEVASATVVDAFQRWIMRRLPYFCENGLDSAQIFDEWLGLAELCNRKILHYGEMHGIRLGTTAAMLLLTPSQYMILNVGDCRVYAVGDEVRQITRDQTVVQQELDAGLLTPEQAAQDKRSHILSQCIGAAETVHPDFYTGEASPETVWLLCCDGFRHKIGAEEFAEYLSPAHMRSCEQMQAQIRELIALNMQRQERDNISAVAVCGTEGEASGSAEDFADFAVVQEFCYTSSTELAESLGVPAE